MPDKHTQGPWLEDWGRLAVGSEQQWDITDSNGVPIADLSETDSIRDPEEVAANARLMAAAPDLLFACRGAVEWIVFLRKKFGTPVIDEATCKCLAAIELAMKGRE